MFMLARKIINRCHAYRFYNLLLTILHQNVKVGVLAAGESLNILFDGRLWICMK